MLLVWSTSWQSPVVLLGAAKLKVDPVAAAVGAVVPKPPNEPVKINKKNRIEKKNINEKEWQKRTQSSQI